MQQFRWRHSIVELIIGRLLDKVGVLEQLGPHAVNAKDAVVEHLSAS